MALSGGGAGLRVPVFVVGSERSGTTLMRVLLNRHREIAMIAEETLFFPILYDRRAWFGDPSDVGNRARIVKAYLGMDAASRFGVDLEELRERLMREGVSWRELFAGMLRARAEGEGKAYGGEKSPWHSHSVETLCEWFPECSVIHMVRDPRDAVSSAVRMGWATRSVLGGARKWRWYNRAVGKVAGRENYLRVRYEDLIGDPEAQLGRICGHIGVEYDGGMREPKAGEGEPRPMHARAYRRVTASRVGLWQEAFRPWEVAVIEGTAGGLLEEYGYERAAGRDATACEWTRAWVEWIVERAIQIGLRLPCTFFRYFRPAELVEEEKWLLRATKAYGRWRSRGRPERRSEEGAMG